MPAMRNEQTYRYKTGDGDETVATLYLDEANGKWKMSGMTRNAGSNRWRRNRPPTITFNDGEDAFFALSVFRGLADALGWKLIGKEEECYLN